MSFNAKRAARLIKKASDNTVGLLESGGYLFVVTRDGKLLTVDLYFVKTGEKVNSKEYHIAEDLIDVAVSTASHCVLLVYPDEVKQISLHGANVNRTFIDDYSPHFTETPPPPAEPEEPEPVSVKP